MKDWADDRPTEIKRIVSLSHCWEAREHPDPYGYQLEKLAAKLQDQDCVFVDYVSLFQFKRMDQAEDESFRRAMDNMHVMYAQEHTRTLRIESLTPEDRLKEAWSKQEEVRVFDEPSGCMKSVPVAALIQNRTPYDLRGWCVAELQWSSTRSANSMSEEVDSEESDQAGVAPMDPKTFRETIGDKLKFTHRSDADSVLKLQERVFKEKAESCKALKLSHLSAKALRVGLNSLDQYPQLESLGVQAVTSPTRTLEASLRKYRVLSCSLRFCAPFFVFGLKAPLPGAWRSWRATSCPTLSCCLRPSRAGEL